MLLEAQAPLVLPKESHTNTRVRWAPSPGHRGGVGCTAILKGHVSLWLKIGAHVFLVGFQALAHRRGRSLQGLDISTVNPHSPALHISVLRSLRTYVLPWLLRRQKVMRQPSTAEVLAGPSSRQVHPLKPVQTGDMIPGAVKQRKDFLRSGCW